MRGAHDRYERSAKDEQAAELRRAQIGRYMQDYFCVYTIYHACYDAWGNVPGTMSNTILHAFVADPPVTPYHPAHGKVPPFPVLKKQAWRALSGEYQRGLLDVYGTDARAMNGAPIDDNAYTIADAAREIDKMDKRGR